MQECIGVGKEVGVDGNGELLRIGKFRRRRSQVYFGGGRGCGLLLSFPRM
jgi:hypothetical protein